MSRGNPLYNNVKVSLQVQDGFLDAAHIIADADPTGRVQCAETKVNEAKRYLS